MVITLIQTMHSNNIRTQCMMLFSEHLKSVLKLKSKFERNVYGHFLHTNLLCVINIKLAVILPQTLFTSLYATHYSYVKLLCDFCGVLL